MKAKLIKAIRTGLTMISPELNTRVNYWLVHRRWLNLKTPKTFEEKVLWLKLKDYIHNPLIIKCADKYLVREYVEEKGCGATLNELLGAYDSADEIPWDELPERFVLKWNFGCGLNLIVRDKSKLDIAATTQKLNRWGESKYWLPFSEMQYKYAPKKLICEKFLEDKEGGKSLSDFKVYCFHGKPEAIMVMNDRGEELKREFFDTEWTRLPNPEGKPAPKVETPRPDCLEEMLEASRKLAEPFPFVRVDFYIVNGKLIFGELTFTPAGGIYFAKTTVHGKDMGDFLHIP